MSEQKEIISTLFERGVLVNRDILDRKVDGSLLEKIEIESDIIVLNQDYAEILVEQNHLVDWYEIDQYRVEAEKERDDELYQTHLQHFKKSIVVVGEAQQKKEKKNIIISSLEFELNNSHSQPSFTNEAKIEAQNPINDNPITKAGTSGDPRHSIINNTINYIDENRTLTGAAHLSLSDNSSIVTVIISHKNIPHKYSVQDFTNFFVSRYHFLENILRHRQDLQHTSTIQRVLQKKERENVSIIGLVENIGETKNGTLVLTLEDLTGRIKVFIPKNKKEIYKEARDVVLDEVVGITGMCGENVIFGDTIVWPDIPSDRKLKKGDVEEYILFLSDIHVGSKLFLREEFSKFLQWINGQIGNEQQRAIANQVKYIIIAGDLVDGVGIYPSQEEELELTTIQGQYQEFSRLLRQIPLDKKIIMCPGNHDAVHLAEPQPIFYQEFAPGLFDLPNVTLVTNPSLINIGKTTAFPGFDVLIYHGYSFDYYVSNVESIRTNGGYHRSDLIMKFLLKRRHLAPSFTSTPYYPSHQEDPLLIKKIPDFFITGHIHYSCVANYKGVTMISGSCWQGKTSFQEKLGHEPEPARVPIINLKTREVKVLRFG
ncbi:DNA-directed DNA polymerase II small subunit [Candidatus Woesearchaeota archaeon]|nr:DNA-directed DNA polymerase II small subunit [Candidatus Woesearchaeota archaeon]